MYLFFYISYWSLPCRYWVVLRFFSAIRRRGSAWILNGQFCFPPRLPEVPARPELKNKHRNHKERLGFAFPNSHERFSPFSFSPEFATIQTLQTRISWRSEISFAGRLACTPEFLQRASHWKEQANPGTGVQGSHPAKIDLRRLSKPNQLLLTQCLWVTRYTHFWWRSFRFRRPHTLYRRVFYWTQRLSRPCVVEGENSYPLDPEWRLDSKLQPDMDKNARTLITVKCISMKFVKGG